MTTQDIDLDRERGAAGPPVVKRQAIGETFVGALAHKNSRDIVKRNSDGTKSPVLKPNGKPRQELVLTLVTMPGTTAVAGLGETTAPAQPGDIVRMILRGKAFAEFLEQTRAIGGNSKVGDIVSQTTTYAQVYSPLGEPEGKPITSQAQVATVPRQKAVGIYGPIEVRRSSAADAAWVSAAIEAYHLAQKAPDLPAAFADDDFA